MKKLKSSLWAKITALILLCAAGAVLALSGLGIIYLYENGGYEESSMEYRAEILEGLGREHLHQFIGDSDFKNAEFQKRFSNFRVNVYEILENGGEKCLYEGLEKGEETQWNGSFYCYASYFKEGHVCYSGPYDSRTDRDLRKSIIENPDAAEVRSFRVDGYIISFTVGDDISNTVNRALSLYSYRYTLAAAAAAASAIALLLFIFLLASAGHRKDADEIVPTWLDRVPFDLLTCIAGAGGFFGLVFGIASAKFLNSLGFAGTGAVAAAVVLTVTLYAMSFASRIKKAGFVNGVWKGCLIYKFGSWIWGWIRKGLKVCTELFKKIPSVIRPFMVFVLCMVFELIVIISNMWEGDNILLWWLVTRFFLCLGAIYLFLCFKELRKGAEELAGGNESYKIDTKHLHGPIREQAEDLNNIGAGISKAMDERMKSERFRTELITNVSHDIKTPITSIVNYVDLLQKEEPENEKMKEYMEVLARQSAKLRKLTEDLVEASKASSGSLPVNPERLELGVLLDQTAGEYSEKLQKLSLELIVTKPEEKLEVMADSRHMWRIFDNLMNNICKYSLPGTRVYLDLEKEEDSAVVSFRNISRDRLNISPEELSERFVRGDASRNTEGSGLGLSIAGSLARLQNGSMDISIDGDLFRVSLTFKLADI